MQKPQLTDTIEKKLLSLIDAKEQHAIENLEPIDATLYLQLAELYKFNKAFNKEAEILSRFVNLNNADHDDLVGLYERIEHATQLSEVVDTNPEPIEIKKPEIQTESFNGDYELKLVPEIIDKDPVSVLGGKKSQPRVDQGKTAFNQKCHKVLIACVVGTGRSDSDEVIQLALELIRYDPRNEKPLIVAETFVGFRKTKAKIPGDTEIKFNLTQVDKKSEPFDIEKITELFKQADFIVSHNDADVERKLIATLIPDVAIIPWYSSQKDIPWTALGFKSARLTQLAINMGERTPRTSLERAITIRRILLKTEVGSSQTYLERLYNMPPMKPMKWTFELTAQHNKLKNAKRDFMIKLGVAVSIGVIVVIGFML